MSFPLRERGLRLTLTIKQPVHCVVVPLAGTWIETFTSVLPRQAHEVVPLAGTWIETEVSDRRLDDLCRRSPCGNVD